MFELLATLSVAVLLSFAVGSIDDDAFYTAGVVEFRPEMNSTLSSSDKLQQHLQAYKSIITSSEAIATDIIVFPEGTLNDDQTMTYVPDPLERHDLCSGDLDDFAKYSEFLVQLSCAARAVQKYLVINLVEKERCPESLACAPSGLNTYNTNVVLDRQGRVVSRYRKVHLYLEPFNRTRQAEHATFATDFGVRFGHFICFDILFYTPAMELVRQRGVKHFIFTSKFYSELPFLTAVQLQHSWAWANNVTLLAAGASYPQRGTTGSGIYAGRRGTLTALMSGGKGERRLLVARVPKTSNGHAEVPTQKCAVFPQTGVKLMKDYQLQNYTTLLLDLKKAHEKHQQQKQLLCNVAGFCCQFHIATQPLETRNTLPQHTEASQTYRLALFSGVRRYEALEWSSLKICAIMACSGDDLSSCGEVLDSQSTDFMFTTLQIEANFSNHEKLLLMPNSLDRGLYPLTPSLTTFETLNAGSYQTVRYTLRDHCSDLLTFGIYGNYFDSSSTLRLSPAILSVAIHIVALHVISYTCGRMNVMP